MKKMYDDSEVDYTSNCTRHVELRGVQADTTEDGVVLHIPIVDWSVKQREVFNAFSDLFRLNGSETDDLREYMDNLAVFKYIKSKINTL